MTAAGGSSFTTAQRMVDGVHGDAADLGTAVQPAIAAGLAKADVFVLHVADLTDGGDAGGRFAVGRDMRHPHGAQSAAAIWRGRDRADRSRHSR